MINRVKKILEEAYFVRNENEIELDILQDSYHNAMEVEGLKEDTALDSIKYLIDDIIKIKQSYPEEHVSKVKASVDAVILEGKHFRELEKLLNGLHEIWIQEEYPQEKQEVDERAHQGVLSDTEHAARKGTLNL